MSYGKIAFINNTEQNIDFDFKYEKIEDTNLNVNNINKSDLNNYYDFILIMEKDDEQ